VLSERDANFQLGFANIILNIEVAAAPTALE
jgi:hypothetical protein